MRSTNNCRAEAILRFWFGEEAAYGTVRPEWFRKDPAFDAAIRERFLDTYQDGAAGGLHAWQESPGDSLALIVLLDQFPRNMFRDSARAFATDPLARDAARHALDRGYDRDALPAERLFFYLPFEHSENLEDQHLACRLLEGIQDIPDVLRYANRHREIIERFGRFPHRNAALGRASTREELAFLQQPGSGF